jgi:hypothetical protein
MVTLALASASLKRTRQWLLSSGTRKTTRRYMDDLLSCFVLASFHRHLPIPAKDYSIILAAICWSIIIYSDLAVKWVINYATIHILRRLGRLGGIS